MQRRANQKKNEQRTGGQAQKSRADLALIALVRLLARQAAEHDFQASQKAQEAANDND